MTEAGAKAVLPTLNLAGDDNTILLEKLPVEILVDTHSLSGNAEARLDLIPRPGIYLYCTFDNLENRSAFHAIREQKESVRLIIRNGSQLDGFITKISSPAQQPSLLVLTWCPNLLPIQASGNSNTSLWRIMFHLFNFNFENYPSFIEQIDLDSDIWKVSIRSLPPTRENQKIIKEKGGYKLTHVGEIRKADNGTFCGKEATDILEILRLFLCFTSGSQCIPTCPSGKDVSGNIVWKQWSNPIEWERTPLSWCDRQNPDMFINLFPYFMAKVANENWKNALTDAIWWYIGANHVSRGFEAGIVFAQTAIERLSYEYAVCEKRLVERQGFEGLRGSDQYRLLLSSLGIPLEIPSSATALTVAAQQKEQNWLDAPHALTQIRNGLVHGGKGRTTLPNDCYIEAWKLTVWILEMVILALCGYRGKHWNRNNRETEIVPWVHNS